MCSPAASSPGAQARCHNGDHRCPVSVQPDLPPASGGMMDIEAHDIAVRFGRTTVLEGVRFTLHAGEMVGLIGPNGSGKTSLLRILANLRAPDAGYVHYGGRSAADLGTRELARRVAYLA